MLLPLNTEVTISLYAHLVLHRLHTPPHCSHLDSDTVARMRRAKVTGCPLAHNRLWAAQRHSRRADVMNSSSAVVNQPRQSVTLQM